MKATKATFEFTANLIAHVEDKPNRIALTYSAAHSFASSNSRFDMGRFFTACKVERDSSPTLEQAFDFKSDQF